MKNENEKNIFYKKIKRNSWLTTFMYREEMDKLTQSRRWWVERMEKEA